MFETIAVCVMLGMLIISVITDLRTGKILNNVTVPCALIGLALGAVGGGVAGAVDHLLGAILVLIVVLLLSPLVGLGGGDVKLLMAVGALQGEQFALWTLLFTGVAGGVLALVTAIRHKALQHTTANLLSNLVAQVAGVSTDLATGSVIGKMHYSLAITLGALTALLLGI